MHIYIYTLLKDATLQGFKYYMYICAIESLIIKFHLMHILQWHNQQRLCQKHEYHL